MPHFDALRYVAVEDIARKGQAISPFLTMFSTLHDTYFLVLNAL